MNKKKVSILFIAAVLFIIILVIFLFPKGESLVDSPDGDDKEPVENVTEFDFEVDELAINKSKPSNEEAVKVDKVIEEIEKGESEEKIEVVEDKKTGETSYQNNSSVLTGGFTGSGVDYNAKEVRDKVKNDGNNNQIVKLEDLNKDFEVSTTVKNGKNKLSGRFEGKLPEKATHYTLNDELFYIIDNKQNTRVFSFRVSSDENIKLTKGEPTFFSQKLTVDYKYYNENKEKVTELIVSSGYELSKEDIEENMKKIVSLKEYDSFDYKKYRFVKLIDGAVDIKKTY